MQLYWLNCHSRFKLMFTAIREINANHAAFEGWVWYYVRNRFTVTSNQLNCFIFHLTSGEGFGTRLHFRCGCSDARQKSKITWARIGPSWTGCTVISRCSGGHNSNVIERKSLLLGIHVASDMCHVEKPQQVTSSYSWQQLAQERYWTKTTNILWTWVWRAVLISIEAISYLQNKRNQDGCEEEGEMVARRTLSCNFDSPAPDIEPGGQWMHDVFPAKPKPQNSRWMLDSQCFQVLARAVASNVVQG